MKPILTLLCVLLMTNFISDRSLGQITQQEPLTVAEKSNFQATSSSADVIDFIRICAERADHVYLFCWGQTVEGRKLTGAIVSNQPYQLGDQDERNVILLLGNIHSGECAGKEALLIMLRELTMQPEHPWLKQNVILFAPNYNADGNDRVGLQNRPGQIGPDQGMGRRENAQQLDLNRDFMKIESPEARALVSLIDKTNPHLFIDCHTTNGSKHRYPLTYDIPHNPTTDAGVRDFMRNQMMPSISDNLLKQGMPTFYYGNFNQDHTRWTSFGHEPRYSTEYVGLRGRLAILSEAYSYISYPQRIEATHKFVSTILDYMTEHQTAIHQLLDAIEDEATVTGTQQPDRYAIALKTKVAAFSEKQTLLGFRDNEPVDYECDFWSDYQATQTTPMPYAYLIPRQFARAVDRLKIHGIQIDELIDDTNLSTETHTIQNMVHATTSFQRHRNVRIETNQTIHQRLIPQGTYVVRTGQPLGRLASYLLEPESDDGLTYWNFFDDAISENSEHPISQILQPVTLDIKRVITIENTEMIRLESIDGPGALLSDHPENPKWFGDSNWIETKVNNRDVLIDAVTGGYVDRPARPYDRDALIKLFQQRKLTQEAAIGLADSDPTIATNQQWVVFSNQHRAFLYQIPGENESTSGLLELGSKDKPAELFQFNSDQSRIAYVTADGLHFLDLASSKTETVAAEHNQQFIGKLDWVYQEELYGRGNFQAYWWNPNGQQIAFLALDESPVIPFTVMDHLPVRGQSEVTNYPKAGDPLPTVKLGVCSADSASETVWVDLSQYKDTEILISQVTWSTDGKKLLIQIQDREQTWLDLIAVDTDGRTSQLLFRDKTEAWIESPGAPVFLSDQTFLWLSPRSGHRHIYQYDFTGKQLSQLTSGNWEVRELLGVDAESEFCFYTAARPDATQLHGYRLNLNNQKSTLITEESGTHEVTFSQDFSLFLDSFSTAERPSLTRLCRNDGQLIRLLAVSSDDRLDYLDITPPEFFQVSAHDGHPLDAMLIRPPDFDPNKKYPVLVHVYAGPQAPKVRDRFGGENYLWHQMLAQQGYLVWICDNRSASFRSSRDVWAIHKQMAVQELADIESGVNWLKHQPWVDQDRIGIWGWSYGGYMTLYALTHSEQFRIGIAGAPVTDWKNYDAIYTERYMGLPQTNPAGYASASVLGKADQLHGNLLLVHGTVDDNVHLNNTMQFVQELQLAGKQFELMLYPDNRHSIKNKKQAAHLRKLMTDFVLDNL